MRRTNRFYWVFIGLILIISGCTTGNGGMHPESSPTGIMPASTVPESPGDQSPGTEEQTSPEEPSLPPLAYTPEKSDLRPAEEMELVPVYTGFPGQFPSSAEFPEGADSVDLTDGYADGVPTDSVIIHRDVVYDVRDGEELTLQIILPAGTPEGETLPLIVYIPGSAWMRQNVSMSIPLMTRVAAQGFAAAIVEYRGTDVAYYPSMLDHTLPNSPEGLLLGGVNVLENPELARLASPLSYRCWIL